MIETPRGSESLTLALQALLGGAGADVSNDDLNAVLGLSWMTAAVPGEPCLARWSAYARDFNLIEAGKLFGLRLRDLHPPDVAKGLDQAPEYYQHFDASYRPLIARALEHGQTVLAWRGWPAPHEMDWGVITTASAEGVGFGGLTPGFSGSIVPLSAAPIQIYIIEEVTPTALDENRLVETALHAAERVLENRLDPRLGVMTGPPACTLWAERVRRGTLCPRSGDCLPACHIRLVEHVMQARASTIRFVVEHRGELEACMPGSPYILRSAARGLIDALCADQHLAAVSAIEQGVTPERRDALAAAILTLRAHEERAMQAVVRVANALRRA